MNESIAKNLTVVVPYFEHINFIRERIDSILSQTIKPERIIILDDASKVRIENLVFDYAKMSNIPIDFIRNSKNNGIASLSWLQLLKEVRTKYVWIAECDDSSENIFLEKTYKLFEDDKVNVAFSASKLIDEFGDILSENNHKNLFSKINWNEPFLVSISDFKSKSLLFGNPIENVGSCIFQTDFLLNALNKSSHSKKLACDWEVYLNFSDDGFISFIPDKLNKFRVHNNTQRATIEEDSVFVEKYQIYCSYIKENYKFDSQFLVESLFQILRGVSIPPHFHNQIERDLGFQKILVNPKPRIILLRASNQVQDSFKNFFVQNKILFEAFFDLIEIIDWWEYDDFLIQKIDDKIDLIINFYLDRRLPYSRVNFVDFIDFDINTTEQYNLLKMGNLILINVTTQEIFQNSANKNILWFYKDFESISVIDYSYEIIDFLKEIINVDKK